MNILIRDSDDNLSDLLEQLNELLCASKEGDLLLSHIERIGPIVNCDTVGTNSIECLQRQIENNKCIV